MLHYEIIRSAAYRSLSSNSRSLIIELMLIAGGDKNGRIGLSQEAAARKLGISVNTVKKAFRELQDRQFLVLTHYEDFDNGKQREWRLTFLPSQNGREPTDEWRNWESKTI